MKDSSDLAQFCSRICRHEDIAPSRESTGAAFHDVCDERGEVAVCSFGPSGSKYWNGTRINNALHFRDGAGKWQLYDICAEVDGQGRRVEQSL
jgi:hypothetical protein